MKIRVILLAALLAALVAVCVARSEPAGPLNPQDTIDPSSASYVIVNAETSEIVEASWERLDQPIPVGSSRQTLHCTGLRRESLFSLS